MESKNNNKNYVENPMIRGRKTTVGLRIVMSLSLKISYFFFWKTDFTKFFLYTSIFFPHSSLPLLLYSLLCYSNT